MSKHCANDPRCLGELLDFDFGKDIQSDKLVMLFYHFGVIIEDFNCTDVFEIKLCSQSHIHADRLFKMKNTYTNLIGFNW